MAMQRETRYCACGEAISKLRATRCWECEQKARLASWEPMRRKLKEVYERREQIGAKITEMHRRFDALRDDAIQPLSDQCSALDDEMLALLLPANATWLEGRFDDEGLPTLEVVGLSASE